MKLFERFRPGDDAVAVDRVGAATFAGLRELVRRRAGTDEQRGAIAAVLESHQVPSPAIDRLLGSMQDGVALFEAGPPGFLPAPCRLGGPAVLPPGAAWPRDRAGRPLGFVGAIDLARVPVLAPLPVAGTLLLFWHHGAVDPEVGDVVDATRVLLVPPGRTPFPATPPSGAPTFAPLLLDPVLMPYPGDAEALQGDDVPAHVPGYELQDALMREFPHQLLGAPRDVLGPVLEEMGSWLAQASPETRCRFSTSELAGRGWALLAQIDGTVGPTADDAGALFLVVPAVDLEAGRFDRVAGVVQCF